MRDRGAATPSSSSPLGNRLKFFYNESCQPIVLSEETIMPLCSNLISFGCSARFNPILQGGGGGMDSTTFDFSFK